MVRVLRSCVYAFTIGFIICAQGIAFSAVAKGAKEVRPLNSLNPIPSANAAEFGWSEHNKLSWDDFRGPVNASSDETAAATHCGIGFRVNSPDASGKRRVEVYNTFYINKSWVRSDAKIASILDHEQGHFDLCEIYTRKLSKLMSNFDFNTKDVKLALMNVFNAVNDEYEARQQAYETETNHGTNLEQQKKWQQAISFELN